MSTIEQPKDIDSIEDEAELVEAIKAQLEQAGSDENQTEEKKEDELEQSEVTDETTTGSDESQVDGEETNPNSNKEHKEDVVEDVLDIDFESDEVLNKPFKKPIMVERKGVKIPVNNLKEVIELLPKSVDYTVKMQQIAPHRKQIDYMQQHQISMDDLQKLAEIKSGSKEALASIARESKIDVWDVDTDSEYNPNPEFQYNEPREVDAVAMEIMSDETWAKSVSSISAHVPDSFKEILATDARALRAFAEDVKNGVAQQLVPEALKLNAMNPNMDFIQAYITAGNNIFSNGANQAPQTQAPAQPAQQQRTVTKVDTANRAKAGSPRSSSSGKASADIDVWEDGLSESELVARIQRLADQARNQ